MVALLLTGVTFLSKLFGGLFALGFRRRLALIIGFSAGVLLAAALFDLIPEAVGIFGFNAAGLTKAMAGVMAGFMTFHILEKFVLLHACQEEECHFDRHRNIGVLGAVGLAFHSLLDGVAIGVGFQAGNDVGFIVAGAVILHSFSDGVSTVSILLANKNSPRHSLFWLLVGAATPFLGVFSTRFFVLHETAIGGLLSFFGGFFIYIGASDLLPEAHRENSSVSVLAATLSGVVLILVATSFLPG